MSDKTISDVYSDDSSITDIQNTDLFIIARKTGITYTSKAVSANHVGGKWGNVAGTLSNQTDLQSALDAKANTADLDDVALSGDYTDLSNTPTIPNSLDDLSGSSDLVIEGGNHLFLTTAERNKLSNTSNTNTGDETAATIKSKLGITTLSGSNTGDQDLSGYATTSSVTTSLAAKQDNLVSGTNIKTINGSTLLGSGDIAISGGSSSDATTSSKGIVQLAGDLGGTAASPKVKRTSRFIVAPYGDTRPADYTCATQYSNQTEINLAIVAANALSNGGVVQLLDGDFYVSSAIIPLDNVTITGAGMFLTRIGVQPSMGSAFTIIDNFSLHDGTTEPNSIRWSITDLEVDGSNFNDGFDGKGIFSIKVQECRMERVYVHHTTATGIGVDDFIRTSMTDCFVEFCGFRNKKYLVGGAYSTGPNAFTFTCSAAHGYSVNDNIVVTGMNPSAFNGIYLVSSVPTTTTFTVSTTNNSNPQLTFNPGTVLTGTTATVTAASWANRFATYTTSAAHSINIGDLIYVGGMTPSAYNGYYPVANVASSTSFSVNIYRNPGTATAFGTVTLSGMASDYNIGHSGIGIATGASTGESALVHHNFTRYNQNNNIFFETNNVISSTATFREQSFAITDNVSIGGGQSGYRNTGSTNVVMRGNYDYGSLIGIHLSAFTLTRTVTAASWVSNVVTYTTSIAHSFSVGDPVAVYGMTPSAYNSYAVITSVPSTTQFTIGMLSDPGTATVFGSAKANVHPTWGTQVDGNIVEKSVMYGLYQETFCDRVSVTNNTFKGSYLLGAYLTSSDTKFTGNEVTESGQYGVQVITAGSGNIPLDNLLIAHNYIRNSGQRQVSTYDGIYVQADTSATANPITSLRITNNHIYDNQVSKTQRYGVVLKSGGVLTDTAVSDNDLAGNATAGLLIQNAGTSSIEAFNNVGVNPESRVDLGTTSGTVTFDRSTGKTFKLILNGNVTAVMTASIDGAVMTWVLQQDGTGSRTLTLPGNMATATGGFTLSTAANAIDSITWIYDLNTTKWRETARATGRVRSVPEGGTGVATLTGLVKANGTSAFTAAAAGTDYLAPSGNGSALTGITESQVTNLTTDLAAKAPLASPALTGTPTAPTATLGTNTTQLATTAFVLANATGGGMTDPTTTKGDLIVHGTVTTRLGVGSDGQVLTADSTQTNGVTWATSAGGGSWTRGIDIAQASGTVLY